MKPLALLIPMLMIGCASTPEKLEQQAMACKHSLVMAEDGTIRTRNAQELDRDCGKLFERHLKALDRQAFREKELSCPEPFILVCRGFSCGRAPRREIDFLDYSCTSRDEVKEMMGVF